MAFAESTRLFVFIGEFVAYKDRMCRAATTKEHFCEFWSFCVSVAGLADFLPPVHNRTKKY